MNQEKLFLKTILAKEENYQNKYDKIFTGISIELTSEYAGKTKITKSTFEKIFKPSKFLPIIVSIIALGLLFGSIRESLNDKPSNGGTVFVFMFSLIIIIMLIKQYVADSSLNYSITLNKDCIVIDDRVILWKDIFTTAIMTVHEGKNPRKFLVIVMNNTKSYETYDLSNFMSFNLSGFVVTASKYIEYFKTQNNYA